MSAAYLVVIGLLGFALAEQVDVTSEDNENITFSGFFTEEWRDEFSDEQLARQPKWKLADDQPNHENYHYQVREYAPAWYVTSFTPCLEQMKATTYGYLKAYLYMNKYNSNYEKYDLTYPIINKADFGTGRNENRGKIRQVRCPNRFSVSFYLPHETGNDNIYDDPARGIDESIIVSEQLTPQRRLVYSYDDVYNQTSIQNCNDQAEAFAAELLELDNIKVDKKSYYCAVYEAGTSRKITFEVWFDEPDE